jgi:hypothetical protein
MSIVVNVKVKFTRPKYDNLKDWMDDENNIYIGRKGIVFIDNKRYPQNDSYWCNPYKLSNHSLTDSLIKYKMYIKNKLEKNPDKILELENKHLGCWCAPNQCHGDILINLLNEYKSLNVIT